MVELKFGSATLDDFHKLILLVNDFDQSLSIEKKQPSDLKKDQARNRKYLRKYLVDSDSNYVLCKKEDQIIGYSFLSIEKSPKSVASINELFVIPSERGNKIGLALLEESLKWLKARNCQQVKLTVNRYNIPATRLYERLGFQLKREHYVDMSLNL
ncbi:GNAT family N-acetyltransferase [Spirosoma validum]|uniref:GNAT family N-acetyltransferase n=1 Tax=Spirosoma validum TaxID=2771355 RepID=A0A927AYN3_9BACT|nr:GNAT family N-acetyltransferase [Spirosoma validum]MBD2752175.1 GNAT family N-acetyltransferase [Spirosoma validum]